jgi:hypothetical protein
VTSTDPAPGGFAAVAVAIGGSVVLGGLTSFAQTVLPDALRPFANSASGWTLLAFLLVYAGRARLLLGTILGVVAFVGLVEGYATRSNLRGFYYSYTGVFTLVAVAAGPVLGFSAALTRHGIRPSSRRLWQVLGVSPLSAVLIGDGVFGLRYVRDTTGTFDWVHRQRMRRRGSPGFAEKLRSPWDWLTESHEHQSSRAHELLVDPVAPWRRGGSTPGRSSTDLLLS